jgi:hypothetical protein
MAREYLENNWPGYDEVDARPERCVTERFSHLKTNPHFDAQMQASGANVCRSWDFRDIYVPTRSLSTMDVDRDIAELIIHLRTEHKGFDLESFWHVQTHRSVANQKYQIEVQYRLSFSRRY